MTSKLQRVIYIGATEEQVKWGWNSDPRGLLTVNQEYHVTACRAHRFHTKIRLYGLEQYGWFNDASFEYVDDD